MSATASFSMRISPTEKAMLAQVAKQFQRSQAGMLKTLVREVYQVMKAEKDAARNANNNQLSPA